NTPVVKKITEAKKESPQTKSKQQPDQSSLKKSENKPPVTQSVNTTWQYIVIHHSATTKGNAKVFQEYHRTKMGLDGLAYHFVVGNGTYSKDGEIEYAQRWHYQQPGPHCFDAAMNGKSLAICLVGDFDKNNPTEKQMIALRQLIRELQQKYNIPTENIIGHKEADPGKTDCPGKNFPMTAIKSRLAAK
ncbi:MAG: peptidoglycan recognition family protein, partial [Planctomycetota bacterium]